MYVELWCFAVNVIERTIIEIEGTVDIYHSKQEMVHATSARLWGCDMHALNVGHILVICSLSSFSRSNSTVSDSEIPCPGFSLLDLTLSGVRSSVRMHSLYVGYLSARQFPEIVSMNKRDRFLRSYKSISPTLIFSPVFHIISSGGLSE